MPPHLAAHGHWGQRAPEGVLRQASRSISSFLRGHVCSAVCVHQQKEGSTKHWLASCRAVAGGALLMCSTLFPQRVVNFSLSKDKKHLLAQWQRNLNQLTLYGKHGVTSSHGPAHSSSFTLFSNLGLQMRHAHLSSQPTPRWLWLWLCEPGVWNV